MRFQMNYKIVYKIIGKHTFIDTLILLVHTFQVSDTFIDIYATLLY